MRKARTRERKARRLPPLVPSDRRVPRRPHARLLVGRRCGAAAVGSRGGGDGARRQPKVDQARLAVGAEQHVRRLQVVVDESGFVQPAQTAQHGTAEAQHRRPREVRAGGHGLPLRLERRAEPLHDEHRRLVVQQRGEALGAVERPEDGRLAGELLVPGRVHRHLDRDATVLSRLAQQHATKAALSQPRCDRKAPAVGQREVLVALDQPGDGGSRLRDVGRLVRGGEVGVPTPAERRARGEYEQVCEDKKRHTYVIM